MLLTANEWNELWASVPHDDKSRDQAADAVIYHLVELGHRPSDESSDDDPVLALQAAMEIGYLLALANKGDRAERVREALHPLLDDSKQIREI